MNRCTRVTFSGSSGADYQFEVYPLDSIFNDFAAVYKIGRASCRERV